MPVESTNRHSASPSLLRDDWSISYQPSSKIPTTVIWPQMMSYNGGLNKYRSRTRGVSCIPTEENRTAIGHLLESVSIARVSANTQCIDRANASTLAAMRQNLRDTAVELERDSNFLIKIRICETRLEYAEALREYPELTVTVSEEREGLLEASFPTGTLGQQSELVSPYEYRIARGGRHRADQTERHWYSSEPQNPDAEICHDEFDGVEEKRR
jgi:hypothetical protein